MLKTVKKTIFGVRIIFIQKGKPSAREEETLRPG